MNKVRYDILYAGAWWVCVVSLPFTIFINSFFIILLMVVWTMEGRFIEKWERIKSTIWIRPFILFFVLHLVGLLYTQDMKTGFFEIEKKLSFLVLPIIAAGGRPLVTPALDYIKKGFVYSCFVIVVVSLIMSASILFGGPLSPAVNFDPQTLQHFHELNPKVSGIWEYFSYIQLGEWIDIHPAYFSMYLIFCVCIVLQDILKKNRLPMVNVALIAAFLFFIVQLSSRMAIVTLPIVVLYLLHAHFKNLYARRVLIRYCIFLGLLFLLIWINPVSRFRILQEPLTTTYTLHQDKTDWNSISFRLLEWTAGAQILQQSLIMGEGTGDAQYELQQHYAKFNSSTADINYNAHNQYLQTALELGLPGICLLVACLVPSWFTIIRQNPLQTAFIVLIGCMCLTESIFARQKGIVFFTLFQSMFLRSSIAP